MEWERGIAIAVVLALIAIVGGVPGLVLAGLFGLAHVVRRLFPLPLVLTVVGRAVIGLMGRPAAAAECDQVGEASWYGGQHHGRLTASGERFDQWAMTAAMPSRSMMGRTVRVCLVSDPGRCVTVRVNDLGPHGSLNRVIDLSRGAAERLDMIRAGVAQVCLSWQ